MPSDIHSSLWTTEPCRPPRYIVLVFDYQGKVSDKSLIFANDDDEARALTLTKLEDCFVELWDWMRFVSCFDPN